MSGEVSDSATYTWTIHILAHVDHRDGKVNLMLFDECHEGIEHQEVIQLVHTREYSNHWHDLRRFAGANTHGDDAE